MLYKASAVPNDDNVQNNRKISINSPNYKELKIARNKASQSYSSIKLSTKLAGCKQSCQSPVVSFSGNGKGKKIKCPCYLNPEDI